jgi:hypothetical protein
MSEPEVETTDNEMTDEELEAARDAEFWRLIGENPPE